MFSLLSILSIRQPFLAFRHDTTVLKACLIILLNLSVLFIYFFFPSYFSVGNLLYTFLIDTGTKRRVWNFVEKKRIIPFL